MLKIVIIEELLTGRPNELFREALCFQRAFSRKGIIADVFDPKVDTAFWKKINEYDIILILQNYDLRLLDSTALINAPGYKVFWSIDSHKAAEDHKNFCLGINADHVLVSSLTYLGVYLNTGLEASWCPNCYPADLIHPSLPSGKVSVKNDVGFCGSVGNRGEWIKGIADRFDMCLAINILGKEMVSAIRSFKVHWNRNEADDINGRTFETMGAGTCLLTNKTPGISKLFEDGKHLVLYETMEECFCKLKELLDDENKRLLIGINGFSIVRALHTYDNRVDRIIDLYTSSKEKKCQPSD